MADAVDTSLDAREIEKVKHQIDLPIALGRDCLEILATLFAVEFRRPFS
jgi:hypothetical protein